MSGAALPGPRASATTATSRTTVAAMVLPLLALAGLFAISSEFNVTDVLSAWAPHLMTSMHGVDHSSAAGDAAVAASASPRPPRLFLAMRGYAGDRHLFYRCFNRSLEAFLDWRGVHLSILLDAEAKEDRAFGAELEARLGARTGASFQIRYLDPPSPAILALRPFAWAGSHYNSEGYTRMLYDSWFLDTWLPAEAGPNDVLGIVDTDAPLMALLPPLETMLHRPSDPPGSPPVLRAQAKKGDEYSLDSALLGVPSTFSMMGAGAMPQFFFVGTFGATRRHVTRVWNASSFDEALIAAINRAPPTHARGFSPCNVMLSYAAAHEAERYSVSLHGDPDARAVPAFGFNKVCDAGPDFVMRRGCCRAFRMEGCLPAELTDPFHISIAGENANPPFPRAELQRMADEHYAGVEAQVASMDPVERTRMIAGCSAATKLKPGQIK